jgi:hypothetical protein
MMSSTPTLIDTEIDLFTLALQELNVRLKHRVNRESSVCTKRNRTGFLKYEEG